MYRKFYEELSFWEDNNIKEPMLIMGARQIGKTWLIKKFCEDRYKDYVYINLEEREDIKSVFEGNLSPKTILTNIGIILGKKINTNTTIVIDEIQQSERALTSLKYFCEAEENYRIIVAGSLLGVKINRFETSFPVGKVYIKRMYPMDFEEFLLACDEHDLVECIKNSYANMSFVPEAIHNKALGLYHDYLIVGGMPQVVMNYVANDKDIMLFNRDYLEFLRLAYLADMSKYVINATETVKISAVYESIPRQLARDNPKFKYKEIKETAVKRDYYGPIDWLASSGMVYKINKLEIPNTPIKSYANQDSFKLYMSDVGILCKMCGIYPNDLSVSNNNIYKGAVIENYVFEQLISKHSDLFYYKPSDSMEIDIVTNIEGNVVPIEIKSGRHKRSTSLKNYIAKHSPEYSIRISENNFGMIDNLKSVPLYAVFCI